MQPWEEDLCGFGDDESFAFLLAADLVRILSQDHHPSYSAEFYSAYINILLGVFYSVCRDLRELRHLVRPPAPPTVQKTQTLLRLGVFLLIFPLLLSFKQAALNFAKFSEPLSEGKGERVEETSFCVRVCVCTADSR